MLSKKEVHQRHCFKVSIERVRSIQRIDLGDSILARRAAGCGLASAAG